MSDSEERVSIYDIARVAGVNPSTVSRALNNRDRISEKTRSEILRIASQLGYQPSAIARSLTTRRTNTIGVVAPSLSDPFFGSVINGIEARAAELDYQVLFSNSQRDPEREATIATNFLRHSVDAVVIVTTHHRSTYETFGSTVSVPLVIVGQEDEAQGLSVVTVDQRGGIQDAFDSLFGLGHRSFAYIGVSDRPYSNRGRLNALKESVAGSEPASMLVEFFPAGTSDLERGRNALEQLLHSEVTAVQCYNDIIALGLVGEALFRGIEIPEAFSVVGFDDVEYGRVFPRPLTTIRQYPEAMGRRAVEVVMEVLAGEPPRHETMASTFVSRETTGPPRTLKLRP